MSAYSFVTAMSKDGYDQYGKAFLESWQRHMIHPEIQLRVYSESWDEIGLPPEMRGWPWPMRLQDDPEWVEFQKNPDDPPDWRYQAKRFSHKVFAVTSPFAPAVPHATFHEIPRHLDWWIWIDADVEIIDTIDYEFLSLACPEWATLSYLGRKDCRTSECGWVAYNLNNGGREFLEEFRRIYTSGDIFSHLEWHDSYIFDRVMERVPGKYFNLSDGEPGMHVWDATILGEKMRHLKGPLRKAGRSLDGLPQEYRSVLE